MDREAAFIAWFKDYSESHGVTLLRLRDPSDS
jgi:hypothetical protein